jgi:hypothetical protein
MKTLSYRRSPKIAPPTVAERHLKRAPFTGVRWDKHQAAVQIGNDWFTLVPIGGIAAVIVNHVTQGSCSGCSTGLNETINNAVWSQHPEC